MSEDLFFTLSSPIILPANSPVPFPPGTVISDDLYLSFDRGIFTYSTNEGVIVVFGVTISSREECFFEITLKSFIPLEFSGKVELNLFDSSSSLFLNRNINLSFGLNSFLLSTFRMNSFLFSLLSLNRSVPFNLFFYRSVNFIPFPVYLWIDCSEGKLVLNIFNPNRGIDDVSRLSFFVPPFIEKVC